MIEFKNRLTGTTMWVDESRVEEYKAAGHKPVVPCPVEKPRARKPGGRKKKKVE